MGAKSGFTLVEVLIVVVILGILAAIVIPQFTSASTQARESSLVSDLHAVRSQIQLYQIQHKDQLPTLLNFEAAMTTETDVDGSAWVAGAGAKYGPYMRKIPNNPFTGSNAVTASGAGDWNYDESTGAFTAADGGSLPDGTAHSGL